MRLAFFARELTDPTPIPAGTTTWIEDQMMSDLKASPGGDQAILDVTIRPCSLAVAFAVNGRFGPVPKMTTTGMVPCQACMKRFPDGMWRITNPLLSCEVCAGERKVVEATPLNAQQLHDQMVALSRVWREAGQAAARASSKAPAIAA